MKGKEMFDIDIHARNFYQKHKTAIYTTALVVSMTVNAFVILGTRDWGRFLNDHPDIKELYFNEED